VKQAADIYNNKRRHRSLEMATPAVAHTYQTHSYKAYSTKDKKAVSRNIDKSEKIP